MIAVADRNVTVKIFGKGRWIKLKFKLDNVKFEYTDVWVWE